MKNIFYFTLLLSIISLTKISAQHLEKSKLIGSWHLLDYEDEGKKVLLPRDEILTFYTHDIFQEKYSYPANYIESTTDTLHAGNWKLNSRDSFIRFTDIHKIPDKRRVMVEYPNGGSGFADGQIEDDSMHIVLLNDSILEISGWFTEGYVAHYRRIPILPQVKDVPFPFTPLPDTTAKTCIYLINSADTSRKIKLEKDDSELSVTYTDTVTDTFVSKTITDNGSIYDLTPDSIWLTGIGQEYISTKFKHWNDEDPGGWGNISTTYEGMETSGRKIKLSTIQNISYSSSMRVNRCGFGSVICGFACFELLVAAPLVSIKYKSGGFNSQRYFTWAGIGLCGLGVSIPLILFNEPKTYFITQKNKMFDKRYWYLEKQYEN